MKDDYWVDRWKQGEIGFHQTDINPYLRQFWEGLRLAKDSEVFVPLCGKSRDMLWLREQQYSVLGIELSAIAVETFFEENALSPHHTACDKFDRFDVNGISILHGDFFDLCTEDLVRVNAVYDRAALVALPSEMRKRYVQRLLTILPSATQILLITLDYPQDEMPGPPFAVSHDEIKTLYRNCAEIRALTQVDVLKQNSRFQERGLSRLQESVFLLKL